MYVQTLFTLALAICPTPPATGTAPPCVTVVVPDFVTDTACRAAAGEIATAIKPAGGGQASGTCTAVPAPLEA